MHIVDRSYAALVERDDEVALAQPGDHGWTVGFDGDDLHGLRNPQRMAPRDEAVDRPGLPDESKVSAADTAPGERPALYPLGRGHRGGEAGARGHPEERPVDCRHPD